MNNDRRKRINRIIDFLECVESDIQELLDEEQEAFDNLPETIQESERGDNMQDAINALQEAVDNAADLQSIIDSLIEAREC